MLKTKNIIREYSKYSLEISDIISQLSDDLCSKCPKEEFETCCNNVSKIDFKSESPNLLINIRDYTFKSKAFKSSKLKCEYHTTSGCGIKQYKPTLCLGYLCQHLKNYYLNNYKKEVAKEFIDILEDKILANPINNKNWPKLKSNLEKVIKIGKKMKYHKLDFKEKTIQKINNYFK